MLYRHTINGSGILYIHYLYIFDVLDYILYTDYGQTHRDGSEFDVKFIACNSANRLGFVLHYINGILVFNFSIVCV